MYFLLLPHPRPDMPDWVNGMIWNRPVTWDVFFRHLFLFGLTRDIFLDSVVDLVYEMRLSLVFPFLYKACVRWPRGTAVASVALYALTSLLRWQLGISYVGETA